MVFVLPSMAVVDYVYTSLESTEIVQNEKREKRASWDDNNAPLKGDAVSNVVPNKVEGNMLTYKPTCKTALRIFNCSTCPFDSEMTSGFLISNLHLNRTCS